MGWGLSQFSEWSVCTINVTTFTFVPCVIIQTKISFFSFIIIAITWPYIFTIWFFGFYLGIIVVIYRIKSCGEIAMKYKFKENKQRCKILKIFIFYMADGIKFLRYFARIGYIWKSNVLFLKCQYLYYAGNSIFCQYLYLGTALNIEKNNFLLRWFLRNY